ncbi:MAG TPA: hypothetical protein VLA84_09540 [Microcoleus sp.]|nr:hypothetical protein [Microcoleus sp.]
MNYTQLVQRWAKPSRLWLNLTVSLAFLFLIWKAFGTESLFTCLGAIAGWLLVAIFLKGGTRYRVEITLLFSGLLFFLLMGTIPLWEWLEQALQSKAIGWLWWCLTAVSLFIFVGNWLELTLLLSREVNNLEDELKYLKSRITILEQGGYWGGLDPVEAATRELKTATNYDSAIEIFEQYPQPILYEAWNKLSNKQKAKVWEWTRRYLNAKGEF